MFLYLVLLLRIMPLHSAPAHIVRDGRTAGHLITADRINTQALVTSAATTLLDPTTPVPTTERETTTTTPPEWKGLLSSSFVNENVNLNAHLQACPSDSTAPNASGLSEIDILVVVFVETSFDLHTSQNRVWWLQMPEDQRKCTLVVGVDYKLEALVEHLELSILRFLHHKYDDLPQRMVFVTGTHDSSDSGDKKYLLQTIPKEKDWLPFPGPYLRGFTFSSFVKERDAFRKSLEDTQKAWMKAVSDGNVKHENGLEFDQTLVANSQFFVTRESVSRRPISMYKSLEDSYAQALEGSEVQFTPKRRWRSGIINMKMIWHQLFLAERILPVGVFVSLDDWRSTAQELACKPWRCSCHRLKVMLHGREPTFSDGEMYYWWRGGTTTENVYFALESAAGSAMRDFYSSLSPTGRLLAGYGPCMSSVTTSQLKQHWALMMKVEKTK